MLNLLRKIVQEVNSAKDLKAAFEICRVKEAMGSQVCSVYLLDPETNRFVLMATEGLNKRSIGEVRHGTRRRSGQPGRHASSP